MGDLAPLSQHATSGMELSSPVLLSVALRFHEGRNDVLRKPDDRVPLRRCHQYAGWPGRAGRSFGRTPPEHSRTPSSLERECGRRCPAPRCLTREVPTGGSTRATRRDRSGVWTGWNSRAPSAAESVETWSRRAASVHPLAQEYAWCPGPGSTRVRW